MEYILLLVPCLLACSAQLADDMQVYEKECLGEDRFQCLNGQCISIELHCNGQSDCRDGSDEELCTNYKADPELCNQTHQFLCEDGLKCIPRMWICNGQSECRDNSDEINCVIPTPAPNATCKGFTCHSDGKCISNAWVCDGVYDCDDETDEYTTNCLYAGETHYHDVCGYVKTITSAQHAFHACLDESFCLPKHQMCDGLMDCRDASDEGAFCDNWTTMCTNFTCGPNSTCAETRSGPECSCQGYHTYNTTTQRCEPQDMCHLARPLCSHTCTQNGSDITCKCEKGYTMGFQGAMDACYAPAPEAMLFFTTFKEINYLLVRSKEIVTVASDLKEAHGVSYDGKHIYWVETEKGHQNIVKAEPNKVAETKEVLVSLGLEDAGDVAVDWMGGNIYFSDAERGIISVCRDTGSACTTLPANTTAPKFVTLDPREGIMYWADFTHAPAVMTARMDGSRSEALVAGLVHFPTGLALDKPNDRLYFVSDTIMGVLLSSKKVFTLFEEKFHHPYSIAVFENTVYWSDWASNTIQMTDKIRGKPDPRFAPYAFNEPVYGMHIYHPSLKDTTSNPCTNMKCTHLCLVTSNSSCICACPHGMTADGITCKLVPGYRPPYLLVAGDSRFTRIQLDALGNAETRNTHFNVDRVQAMAYDPNNDTLYVYDQRHRQLKSIHMSEFTLGYMDDVHHLGLDDIVDMDIDYIADTLYMVDASREVVEVMSLRTKKRAILKRFIDETPVSVCVMPNYGKMLIAVLSKSDNRMYIKSYDLDAAEGTEEVLVENNLKGPHVRIRYLEQYDNVYFSDDGSGIIDYMHPKGAARERYRELSTSIVDLAVSDTYVFWSDRRSSRIYWADVHESSPKIRRMEFTMFPPHSRLHLQTVIPRETSKKSTTHPCRTKLCSDVCVQSITGQGYKCLCPPGTIETLSVCEKFMNCTEDQGFCYKSNSCFKKSGYCDGVRDCPGGEDEENCPVQSPISTTPAPEIPCSIHEVHCNGICIDKYQICEPDTGSIHGPKCNPTQFQCIRNQMCISRSQMCDGRSDCPDNSDEDRVVCSMNNCMHTEFRCKSGSCVMASFRCDGDYDCADHTDEHNCASMKCSAGHFMCHNDSWCININRRCNGRRECDDGSDELGCEIETPAVVEPPTDVDTVENCNSWEHTCEFNRSICIPYTARCNGKADCPGATDETSCPFNLCGTGWDCSGSHSCVPEHRVCDGERHCPDGSDESPEACTLVRKSLRPHPGYYVPTHCSGFRCKNGRCQSWDRVCDNIDHCDDNSDEGGKCKTACVKPMCSHTCQPTPDGGVCHCPQGLRLDINNLTCVDVDECAQDACAQACYNIRGSYFCSCHYGYVLRTDRFTCKAVNGNMSIYHLMDDKLVTTTAGELDEDPNINTKNVYDVDIDVRQKIIYLTSRKNRKLVKVDSKRQETTVTNIGRPTKVSVDWITGNVYFVDSTPRDSSVRVCNVQRKSCAKLQRLPTNSNVTALVVDPASRRMFYCVQYNNDSVVWSATLSGQKIIDVASVKSCSGLTLDSFQRKVYVATTEPPRIMRMDYDGKKSQDLFNNSVVHNLEPPRGLAIFEGYIYYRTASNKLFRCILFRQRLCEVIHQVVSGRDFKLAHGSLQRDDVMNMCAHTDCNNVCVMDDDNPVCVCNDGSISRIGQCPLAVKEELPLFDGKLAKDYDRGLSPWAVAGLVGAMLCIAAMVGMLYKRKMDRGNLRAIPPVRMQVRPRRTQDRGFTEEDPASPGTSTQSGVSSLPTPSVHISEEGMTPSSTKHEYANPFEQFYRNYIMRQRRPGTSGLPIVLPQSSPPQNGSDTESDLDEKIASSKQMLPHA